MASVSPPEKPLHYACKCLNVQIISSTQSPTSSPEGTCDPAYTPIFVNDDGIVITHPQVTVRTTTRPESIQGTLQHSRFTILTCLLCGLPIYRVFQTISLEIQGNESTLLPTDDWMEHDVLKSATGWIQVHKDSIFGDSISQAKLSPSYTQSFSLLLSPSSSSPSSLLSPELNSGASPSTSTEPPIQTYLSEPRPLFSPPPFTPSHPIFVHLASIANKESQNLRGTAEQCIADFVKAEMAGIDAREQELRRQVEILWKTYRDHLNTVQQAPRQPTSNVVRSPVSRSFGLGAMGTAMSSSSSVAVRNFNPVPISPPLSPPSSVPRISALSASLATSTFHHLNTNETHNRSPARPSGSCESASSRSLSTYSKSSTLVPDATPVTGSNVLQFRRNVNDTINTQASYKYFINLEEDMARYKRSQEATMKEQQEAEAAKRAQQAQPSQVASGADTNGKLVHAARLQTPAEDGSTRHNATSPRGRDKGKRKVTFDIEPAVMTIKAEDEKVKEDMTTEPDAREMVFSIEDLEGEENTGESSDIQHSTLPLLEQPASRPLRPRKLRQQNIETFTALRPTSLPSPSYIRPMRSQPHVDSSSQVMLPRPKVLAPDGSLSPPLQHGSSQKPTSEHDAELLKLVAAYTPSHRGAWTPDSRAWQTFTRRQDSKEVIERSGIPEEREETMEDAAERPPAVTIDRVADEDSGVTSVSQPVSSSAPISIVIRNQLREPLSLASYRPKTTMPNLQQSSNGDVPSLHAQKTLSSTSVREAKYTERDRSRSMDPGIFDFATGENKDDVGRELEVNQTVEAGSASGERGRKQALKILKSRSELPEAGMWRSLAS